MKTLKITLLAVVAFFSSVTFAQETKHHFKNLSAGDGSSYFIRDDGSLWTCGWNEKGQLGVPEVKERTAVLQLASNELGWKMAVGCKAYAFFLKEDGSMWSVGTQESGVQGTNDGKDHKTLTRIGTDNDWEYVSGCHFWGYAAFAIKKDGTLWGWGSNRSHELGLGEDLQNKLVPTQIGKDNDWKKVVIGESAAVALKKDGTLWGWGNNQVGSLGSKGNPSVNFIKVPTKISQDNDWKDVVCVAQRTYAIKNDGTLWATGDNQNNMLGFNESDENFHPMYFGFKKVEQITKP
ncbi:MAG: hypothetical protein Q4A76_08265, partial [Porphyromonadaceae bacterium]|nr:hypothetical protein [Porphyromonadaceae bacterium]